MILPNKNTIVISQKYVIERQVPVNLEILAEKGKSVQRDTIIASGNEFKEKVRIDVSVECNVRSSEIKRHMMFIHGERVKKGDVIFAIKGKGGKKIKSPCSGVISLSEIDEGIISILGASNETNIYAGVAGKVIRIIPHRQVQIECTVIRVRPFALYGNSIQGELYYVGDKDGLLDADLAGGIVVLSYNTFLAHMRSLNALGINGVIVSGTDATLLQRILDEIEGKIPLCLLEGFGKEHILQEVDILLQKNDGYISFFDSSKEELILTYIQKDEKFKLTKPTVVEAKKGQHVQVFRPEIWGKYGILSSIKDNHAEVLIREGDSEKKYLVHANNILVRP